MSLWVSFLERETIESNPFSLLPFYASMQENQLQHVHQSFSVDKFFYLLGKARISRALISCGIKKYLQLSQGDFTTHLVGSEQIFRVCKTISSSSVERELSSLKQFHSFAK